VTDQHISTAEALRLGQYAERNRKHVAEIREMDPEGSAYWLCKSEEQEGQAAARLHLDHLPAVGPGGEFVCRGEPKTMAEWTSRRKPDAITAEASQDRLSLIERAGAHNLALDLVQDTKPRNSRERLLAHAEATMHALGMKLVEKALEQADAVEIPRLSNAACKCFSTAQEAALAVAKLRAGSRQTVEVRHVHVAPGGQAIVGNVTAGSRKRRGRSERNG
jgi:hypothetical protein